MKKPFFAPFARQGGSKKTPPKLNSVQANFAKDKQSASRNKRCEYLVLKRNRNSVRRVDSKRFALREGALPGCQIYLAAAGWNNIVEQPSGVSDTFLFNQQQSIFNQLFLFK